MWRFPFRYLSFHKLGAVILENVLVVTCIMLGVGLGTSDEPPLRYYTAWLGRAFFIALTFQILMHLRDVYNFRAKLSTREFLYRLVQALTMGYLAVSGVAYGIQSIAPPPIRMSQTLLLLTLFLAAWHILLRTYF